MSEFMKTVSIPYTKSPIRALNSKHMSKGIKITPSDEKNREKWRKNRLTPLSILYRLFGELGAIALTLFL